MPPLAFIVDRREAGLTLAAVLKKRFGIPWSQAKRLVEKRHVRVSGQVETDVARRLKVGKRVQLDTGAVEGGSGAAPPSSKSGTPKTKPKAAPDVSPASKRPQSPTKAGSAPPLPIVTDIDIVYADDALVVVNKPAGLTTMRHKSEAAEFGRGQKFLTKTLGGLLPSLLGTPGRPVIAVHRIDRDTSGLVVFARNRAAAEHLEKQFRKHTTERRYLALTRGVPTSGRIDTVFVEDRGDGRRGSTIDEAGDEGRRAVTHVKLLEDLGQFALVQCRLQTGRTHQVRIHLGEAGTPLCGEKVYDRTKGTLIPDTSHAKRPMLHAAHLGFFHPETDEEMDWDAEPPADFKSLLAELRKRAKF